MEEREINLSIRDLELWFKGDYSKPKILNKVSFDVHKGETLGIAGESGCGKSVTSLSILRLLKSPPAELKGTIEFHGENLLEVPMKRMRQIRGNQITMIFQEPMTSLNPLLKVGFQISEVLRLHQGMSREEAMEKAVESHDRHGTGLQPGDPDRGRTDDGTGRDDPGTGPEAHEGTAGAARDGDHIHHA